jgi:hypothetical protein
MASQTGATRSNDSLTEVEVRRNDNQLADRANDAVERRAYSFFLAAGGQDGQDLTHWLQAESEVLRRIPDIREAASWYTVNVPLPGFAAEQIRVNVGAGCGGKNEVERRTRRRWHADTLGGIGLSGGELAERDRSSDSERLFEE